MDLAQPDATRLLADLLATNTGVRFTVTGSSMRPFLLGGETVVLQRTAPRAIRVGDLVLTKGSEGSGRGLVLHRVTCIRRRSGLPTLFVTQGDALRAPDEAVPPDRLLGRVTAVLDRGNGAAPLDLDMPFERLRGLLTALRQRVFHRYRTARRRR